jgi:hypothetical protein
MAVLGAGSLALALSAAALASPGLRCVVRPARARLHGLSAEQRIALPVLGDPRRRALVYSLSEEPTPTDATLRAVTWFEESLERGGSPVGRGFAVGDRGTVLRRAAGSWTRERTPTRRRLHGVAPAPLPAAACGGVRPVIAVGAGGTAIVRGDDGVWRSEDAASWRDLFAVFSSRRASYAVGAGGTLRIRSPEGRWSAAATHTRADLHAVGACGPQRICAAGSGGAMVACVEGEGGLACAPERPVAAAVRAISPSDGSLFGTGLYLVRRNGPQATLAWDRAVPFAATSDAIRSAAGRIAVGLGGVIWLLPGSDGADVTPPLRLLLPSGVDLHGASFERDGGFAVGDHGTVIHLAVDGLCQPIETLHCAGIGLTVTEPALAEWTYWLGAGGRFAWGGFGSDARYALRLGGAVDFSIARFGPEHGYGGLHEVRAGPWVAVEGSEGSRIVEGGAAIDLGRTAHAPWGTLGLRFGPAALRRDARWHALASATLSWGVRSVAGRHAAGGACVGGCDGLWGIDRGGLPRDHALSSGARLFATARLGEEDAIVVLGVELEPSFLLPPYSLGKLAGARP